MKNDLISISFNVPSDDRLDKSTVVYALCKFIEEHHCDEAWNETMPNEPDTDVIVLFTRTILDLSDLMLSISELLNSESVKLSAEELLDLSDMAQDSHKTIKRDLFTLDVYKLIQD